MKISNVKAELTERDIMGIIDEYVEIEGLTLNKVEINNFILVSGIYHKGIAIPFNIEIGVGSVRQNSILLKIMRVKAGKVPIIKGVADTIMNKFIKGFEELGISSYKDNLIIDFNMLSKLIPFVYFKINKVIVSEGKIQVEAEDVIYSQDKQVKYLDKDEIAEPTEKKEDAYAKIRKGVINKVPSKYKNIAEYIMILPDICALLARMLKDDRINVKTKLIIGGTLAYIASPINIIAIGIPVIGQIDEVGVVFFALDKIIAEVPREAVLENWQGKDDIIIKIQEGAKIIFNTIGSANASKILRFINGLSSKKVKRR
ncbi:MAG: DUF1232 domain-containing protein [Bacillota bacterium]|nr:DUF1232 domain-containing protein [Bacillota bacterium]